MVKQGILKTLEAIIALFITFTALFVFIPRESATDQLNEPKEFLHILRENPDFRSCISAKNTTCINGTIDDSLDDSFDFRVNLSDDPNALISGLPDTQIFSEALFITGNVTNSSTTIIRVFYWSK